MSSAHQIIEIADSDGNVIADVRRIRLGPGLTLTRNDGDPSAVIDAGTRDIPDATESTSGLMSAADKVKADLQDIVHSAAFSSVSSIDVTWAAGKYRRIEIRWRCDTGSATNTYVSLDGIASGYRGWSSYQSYTGAGAGDGAWAVQQYSSNWQVQNGSVGGAFAEVSAWIAAGGRRMMLSRTVDGTNGYSLQGQGDCSDTSTDVGGVTVNFGASSSGHLEVIGYA